MSIMIVSEHAANPSDRLLDVRRELNADSRK